MALGTYTDLQSGVMRWLRRVGDTVTAADVPNFIELAEARINRDLRVRQMETTTDPAAYLTTAGVATLALPGDFLEPRELYLATSPLTPLSYLTPANLTLTHAASPAGKPEHFTVIGSNLKFGPVPGAVYGVALTYYQRIPALSADAPTNWLLTLSPDVYLYATLIEASPYLKNDARLATWADLYQRAIGAITAKDQAARWGGASLQVSVDVRAP